MSASSNHASFNLHACTPEFQALIQPFLGQKGFKISKIYDCKFLNKLAQLHTFAQHHGHANVPKSHPKLGGWMSNIRTAYQGKGNIKLTQPRIKALNKLGFIWDVQRYAFYQKFKLLKRFVKQHGHANVPASHPELGRWVHDIRTAYQGKGTTKLTPPRIKALNKLGFIWDVQRYAFYQKFKLLKHFVKQHGHANVPKSHPKLGTWVRNIRAAYQGKGTTKLTPPRIKALNNIGFVWAVKRGPKPRK